MRIGECFWFTPKLCAVLSAAAPPGTPDRGTSALPPRGVLTSFALAREPPFPAHTDPPGTMLHPDSPLTWSLSYP